MDTTRYHISHSSVDVDCPELDLGIVSVGTQDQVRALRLRTAQPSSTPTGRPRSSLLLLLALNLALDSFDSTGVQVGTTHPLPVLAVRRVSDDFGSPEAPVSLVVAVVGERVVGSSVGLSVCNASVRAGRIIDEVELRQVMSSRVRSAHDFFAKRCEPHCTGTSRTNQTGPLPTTAPPADTTSQPPRQYRPIPPLPRNPVPIPKTSKTQDGEAEGGWYLGWCLVSIRPKPLIKSSGEWRGGARNRSNLMTVLGYGDHGRLSYSIPTVVADTSPVPLLLIDTTSYFFSSPPLFASTARLASNSSLVIPSPPLLFGRFLTISLDPRPPPVTCPNEIGHLTAETWSYALGLRKKMSPQTLGLLVAGGQSTRMGSDKAFLPYPLAPGSPTSSTSSTSSTTTKEGIEEHTESLWIHLLKILLRVCPEGVVVSHNSRQSGRMEQDLKGFLEDSSLSSSSSSSSSPSNSTSSHKQPHIELLPDAPPYKDLGPASALLTAHQAHPSATFLVVAVDFPFVTFDTLQHLLDHHNHNHLLDHHQEPGPSPSSSSTPPEPGPSPSPVTTYFHPLDMHPEPLLSVWGPEALRRLRRNAIEGVTQADGGLRRRTGPCFTAKELWKEIVAFEAEDKTGSNRVDEQANVNLNIPERGQSQKKSNSNHKANPKDKPKPKDELPPAIITRFGVLPKTEGELRNTNTREEWDAAVEELKAGYGLTGEAGRG
ncbi:hypothetical protein HD553DRAFT_337816 [Filobasidium floriforme]|uniref:uncharacterized protein n=1 Tax=Filobasidium floriforme TaxID=5210 RepID=UPI001E8CF0A7|nr:uncharacterized protein HD553DRAFT_337816 [Filobasidium floriforme]KAH8077860.1 hypothetical protein HD553DRAFT_337816 [Filobasidium floriforme]